MNRIVLSAIVAGLLLIVAAGCGGSSDQTPSDEGSNQGITFNKYSKGSSNTKTDSSIKSTKPSNNTTRQTNTPTSDPPGQQTEKSGTNTAATDNPTEENTQNLGGQNTQSGTTTNTQPTESWTDQIDEKNKPSGDPGSLPCRFVGAIRIDGSDAPPGTLVEAYVGTEKFGEWITIGRGYKLDVTGSHPDKMISIRVNGITAAQEPWQKGGNITLDLSIP